MLNFEQEISIKKTQTFNKKNNLKIPELKIKVGNLQMKYKDYQLIEQNKIYQQQRYYSPDRKRLYFNDIKNEKEIQTQRIYNSEDINISTEREISSSKRIKKSILKRNSTLATTTETKKNVKFAGNSNEEPLETVIFINNNNENVNNNNNEYNNDKGNKDDINCQCACFIF
jgi:hypothetical protein